jgi:hypothetical protein
MDKRIAALEEALVIWSNAWGNCVTEWGMNRAQTQILKITRQLEQLK